MLKCQKVIVRLDLMDLEISDIGYAPIYTNRNLDKSLEQNLGVFLNDYTKTRQYIDNAFDTIRDNMETIDIVRYDDRELFFELQEENEYLRDSIQLEADYIRHNIAANIYKKVYKPALRKKAYGTALNALQLMRECENY